MKKIIILTLVLLAFSLFADQGRQADKPNAEMILEHLSQKLDLSAEQQENIKPIVDEQIALMEEFHQEGNRRDRTAVMEFEQKNEDIAEKIKTHLDKNQQVEYDKMREEMKQSRGRRPERK